MRFYYIFKAIRNIIILLLFIRFYLLFKEIYKKGIFKASDLIIAE